LEANPAEQVRKRMITFKKCLIFSDLKLTIPI
jgi:hypothetical protein